MLRTNEEMLKITAAPPGAIAAGMRERAYSPGEVLLQQGAEPTEVVIIREGVVKAQVLEENGREYILGFSGSGEILGENETFLGVPVRACITAINEVRATVLSAALFQQWIDIDRDFRRLIFRGLAARLYALTGRASAQVLYPLEYTVLKYLYLSRGALSGFGKEDLASYFGTSLRSLNRLLKGLEDKGLITRSGGGLRIITEESVRHELMRYERGTPS